MKYESPKVTALTPAINAIQATKVPGSPEDHPGSGKIETGMGAYEDWE